MSAQMFDLEAYWASAEGALLHGTIEVEAQDLHRAIEYAFERRLKPSDADDIAFACCSDQYPLDYYDLEPIG